MALAQRGLNAEVQLWPNGEMPATLTQWDRRPVAKLTLTPQKAINAAQTALFAQVLKRHTPKAAFDVGRAVDANTLRALVGSLDTKATARVMCAGTVDAAAIGTLRSLCNDAGTVEINTDRTMLESMKLLRVGPAEISTHRDGISINTPFIRAIHAVGLLDRTNAPQPGDTAHQTAVQRFGEQALTAMGFVWLSTPGNTRSDQIEAGRAYVRLQLKAVALGVGIHPLSQALQEFPEMAAHYANVHRQCLQKPAPAGPRDDTLQMLCRLGYPVQPAIPTPRRPLAVFQMA